jgi:transcriptional regulator with XRE-family HTH domain
MSLKEEISSQILCLLNKNGWTKSEFAEMMNADRSSITRWISGKCNFEINTIEKMEYVFDEKIVYITGINNNNEHMTVITDSSGRTSETEQTRVDRDRRMECLKMATMHATPEQVETGAVYKIAEDYYNYIINGKKLINNQ